MHAHPSGIALSDIVIWLFWYVTYGAGQWVTLWECAGKDLALMIVLTTGTIWFARESMIYAWKCGLSAKEVDNVLAKEHYINLRNVFFQNAIILLAINVACWFVTPYMLIALLIYHNAFRANRLNRSKDDLYHWQQAKYQNKPVTRANVANDINQDTTLETLNNAAIHLRSLTESK